MADQNGTNGWTISSGNVPRRLAGGDRCEVHVTLRSPESYADLPASIKVGAASFLALQQFKIKVGTTDDGTFSEVESGSYSGFLWIENTSPTPCDLTGEVIVLKGEDNLGAFLFDGLTLEAEKLSGNAPPTSGTLFPGDSDWARLARDIDEDGIVPHPLDGHDDTTSDDELPELDPSAFVPPDEEETRPQGRRHPTRMKSYTPPQVVRTWRIISIIPSVPRALEAGEKTKVEVVINCKEDRQGLPSTLVVKTAVVKILKGILEVSVISEDGLFWLEADGYHGTLLIENISTSDRFIFDEHSIQLFAEDGGVEFKFDLPISVTPPPSSLWARVEGNGVNWRKLGWAIVAVCVFSSIVFVNTIYGMTHDLTWQDAAKLVAIEAAMIGLVYYGLVRYRRGEAKWYMGTISVLTAATVGIAWGFGTAWTNAFIFGLLLVMGLTFLTRKLRGVRMSGNMFAGLTAVAILVLVCMGTIRNFWPSSSEPEVREEVASEAPTIQPDNGEIEVPDLTAVVGIPTSVVEAPPAPEPSGPPATLPDLSTCSQVLQMGPLTDGKWGAVCGDGIYTVTNTTRDANGVYTHTNLVLLSELEKPTTHATLSDLSTCSQVLQMGPLTDGKWGAVCEDDSVYGIYTVTNTTRDANGVYTHTNLVLTWTMTRG